MFHPYFKRKIAIFPIALVLLCSKLSAQLDFRRTQFGIVAGPNYSRVQHAHYPSKERISFYAGVFARIPLSILCSCENSKFYLQPQIEYIQSGEKGSVKLQSLYANNYISIPIFLKTYPIRYNELSYFFVQVAPRFSFLVSQKVRNPTIGRPYAINQDGKANWFDFSVSAAGGIAFGERKNELLLRYDYSFSNTYPQLNEYQATGDPNAQLRKIQQIVSVAYSRIIF